MATRYPGDSPQRPAAPPPAGKASLAGPDHRAIDRGLAEIRDGRFRLVRPIPPYMRAAYGQYDGARLARPKPRRRPRGPARGRA